jgi:hypothetical protein
LAGEEDEEIQKKEEEREHTLSYIYLYIYIYIYIYIKHTASSRVFPALRGEQVLGLGLGLGLGFQALCVLPDPSIDTLTIRQTET